MRQSNQNGIPRLYTLFVSAAGIRASRARTLLIYLIMEVGILLMLPKFKHILSTLAVAAMCALAPLAHADVVLYSTGFENPPFTTGPIAGQDGWNVFGPGISTVENTFVKTGSQAVFIDGSTASQSGPFHSDFSTGTPFVDLSADIAIFSSSTQSEWQFAGLGPGLAGFLGGINVLPNDQIQLITPSFTTLGGLFPRATAFDSTAWHHIDLLFNMVSQQYDVSLDGSLLASDVPFCGSNAGCSGAFVPAYGTGLFDSFGGGNDSAYMDNYRVANVNAVPEPSHLLLLGSAVLGLAALRRKFSV